MKRTIIFLLCGMIGLGVGWYFGYSSLATKQRELLKKYQRLEDVKNKDDNVLALFVTEALEKVDNAGTNQPEQVALHIIGEYYYEFHHDRYNGWDVGDTNVMAQIEAASEKYPAVGRELAIKK